LKIEALLPKVMTDRKKNTHHRKINTFIASLTI